MEQADEFRSRLANKQYALASNGISFFLSMENT